LILVGSDMAFSRLLILSMEGLFTSRDIDIWQYPCQEKIAKTHVDRHADLAIPPRYIRQSGEGRRAYQKESGLLPDSGLIQWPVPISMAN